MNESIKIFHIARFGNEPLEGLCFLLLFVFLACGDEGQSFAINQVDGESKVWGGAIG